MQRSGGSLRTGVCLATDGRRLESRVDRHARAGSLRPASPKSLSTPSLVSAQIAAGAGKRRLGPLVPKKSENPTLHVCLRKSPDRTEGEFQQALPGKVFPPGFSPWKPPTADTGRCKSRLSSIPITPDKQTETVRKRDTGSRQGKIRLRRPDETRFIRAQ